MPKIIEEKQESGNREREEIRSDEGQRNIANWIVENIRKYYERNPGHWNWNSSDHPTENLQDQQKDHEYKGSNLKTPSEGSLKC